MKIACFHILFPYSENLPAWRPKDANATLMSFPRLFTEGKKNFFQDFMINVFKIDEIHDELSTSYFVT